VEIERGFLIAPPITYRFLVVRDLPVGSTTGGSGGGVTYPPPRKPNIVLKLKILKSLYPPLKKS